MAELPRWSKGVVEKPTADVSKSTATGSIGPDL